MPTPTAWDRLVAWNARRKAAIATRAATERAVVNLHPWTKPETVGEERARAALERFPSIELAVTLLHHGMAGQEPLSVSRVADRLGRSFMEVGATLHAAEMRARNNKALRVELQAVLDEIVPDVLRFADDLVALRTRPGWTRAKEERLLKTWFFARKPIQRFALSALWDGPVPFACDVLQRQVDEHADRIGVA
jgi:hypothetical protein